MALGTCKRVFKDGENQCCVLIPCIVHCENVVLHSHLKGCDIVDDLHHVKLFVVGRVVWNGQMHGDWSKLTRHHISKEVAD